MTRTPGSSAELTAEEITALRRVERKGAKLAKKLERDAEKLVAATAASSSAASVLSGSAPGTPTATATVFNEREEDGAGGERTGPATAADPKGKAKADEDEEADRGGGAAVEADDVLEETQEAPPDEWQLDAEHAQLQPEEAFFLSFALGTLALVRPDPSPFFPSPTSNPSPSSAAARLSILETFRLFLESAAPLTVPPPRSPTALLDPRLNRLDSPFLLSYAAYHHFRSMGWVARSGTKFCVDWVLYGQGGPVGGHAEYVTRGALINPI